MRMKDAFTTAQRRLEEAEKRLAGLREGLRVAAEQGRLHLLPTLQTVLAAEELRINKLRAEVGQSGP
jgi:hypothetical protein